MARDTKPRFIVAVDVTPLESPHDPEGWHRLRRFLKAILRGYGLKCEGVWPTGTPGAPDATAEPDDEN